jgi:uncharacterized ion transporter superfamily protein YfcC
MTAKGPRWLGSLWGSYSWAKKIPTVPRSSAEARHDAEEANKSTETASEVEKQRTIGEENKRVLMLFSLVKTWQSKVKS